MCSGLHGRIMSLNQTICISPCSSQTASSVPLDTHKEVTTCQSAAPYALRPVLYWPPPSFSIHLCNAGHVDRPSVHLPTFSLHLRLLRQPKPAALTQHAYRAQFTYRLRRYAEEMAFGNSDGFSVST